MEEHVLGDALATSLRELTGKQTGRRASSLLSTVEAAIISLDYSIWYLLTGCPGFACCCSRRCCSFTTTVQYSMASLWRAHLCASSKTSSLDP